MDNQLSGSLADSTKNALGVVLQLDWYFYLLHPSNYGAEQEKHMFPPNGAFLKQFRNILS